MPRFYAVARGRQPGVYSDWESCEKQIKGFQGARYKRFDTFAQAEEFVNAGGITEGQVVRINKEKTTTSNRFAEPSIATTSKTSFAPIKRTASPTEGDEAEDVVYCDGACKGNGRAGSIAGVGVWWGHGDLRNIAERCPGAQTNNRAELIAIIRVLEQTPLKQKPLRIKSDSKYSIQCVTEWLPGWRRRNWISSSGTAVKNKPLIQYIDALLRARKELGQKVTFEHVYGHVGIEGNEGADRLANEGATKTEEPEKDWEALTNEVEEATKKKNEEEKGGKKTGILTGEDVFGKKECNVFPRIPAHSINDRKRPARSSSPSDAPARKLLQTQPIGAAQITSSMVEKQLSQEVDLGFTVDDLLSDDELEAELRENH